MSRYEVRYEFIENKFFYLELLEEILEKGEYVDFNINGLIVTLAPGMNAKEIEKVILQKNKDFNLDNTFIEIEPKESLLSFSKRITRLAKENNKFYSSNYRGRQIRVVPESTDFDVLYQIVQINLRYLEMHSDKCIDKQASAGQDYMQFGKTIYPFLNCGYNVLGHFNGITIPFTSDMTRNVEYSKDYTSIDAMTFCMMFHNMMNAKEKYYEATEGCELASNQEENTQKKLSKSRDYWKDLMVYNLDSMKITQ